MKLTPTLLAVLLLIQSEELPAADAPAGKPNIVFFLIDDLGYADCGFNGGNQIRTPNIDKLARGGAVLESHYVQPVCSPTRSALLTGRYPTRTGVYTVVRPHAKWGLPLRERTLADALRGAGYETAIAGKWHLGEFDRAYLPTARGFDHQYGHYFGALDYFTHLRDGTHDWHRDDRELHEEGYTTQLVAREACRLLAEKDQSRPLFLYVPFNGVHAPLQVPEKYLEPYTNLKGPRRKLAGMLAAVDEAIGQIVAALDKADLRSNTLIVFSSDNGGPRPGDNTPLRGFKGGIYEGGVRGCAFANWPGRIPAGQRIKQPMHVIDWYPTLITLAGGNLEQKLPIDGRDVWPMLTEQAPSPHDAILCAKSPTVAAVRIGDWKLVRGNAGNRQNARANRGADAAASSVELYNLAADIGETNNLAEKEPERVAAMQARLTELLKDAVPSGAPGR
ncbi:MAG TPA: arylsulfatase, partial [Planctomycetaceae bacterium]|nr:arylsulfatase [Planctomycetaceae bacterium]